MTSVQPMKMAAAEALYQAEQPASFSVFTIGSLDGSRELFSVRVPNLLSFLATGTLDGRVYGINDLQDTYQLQYGPGDYRPIIPLTYWTFRLMIGTGAPGRSRRALDPVGPAPPLDSDEPLGRRDGAPAPAPAPDIELAGLGLHRDGPPAVDRVRLMPTAAGVSPGTSAVEC